MSLERWLDTIPLPWRDFVKTRLMFRCTEIITRHNAWGSPVTTGEVRLAPYIPKEDDPNYKAMKEFYSYTPGGEIKFNTINDQALAMFEVGKDYVIDISVAP